MNTTRRATVRTAGVAIRAMLVFTVLLGIGYTAVVTGLGQALFPGQANGSLVASADGQTVGSALIGQAAVDENGDPLPEYFQSRPSAAGDGYDGAGSSGSNLGPNNEDLVSSIAERRAEIAAFNDVPESEVPADAVTASASGLDPDISPEYAEIQVARVAEARGMSADAVREIVAAHTQGSDLGFLGDPTVNVLELNLALDEAKD